MLLKKPQNGFSIFVPRISGHFPNFVEKFANLRDLFNQLYSSLRIQSPSQMMIGVYNHFLRKVFRFHYHSQKVIGSLGVVEPNVASSAILESTKIVRTPSRPTEIQENHSHEGTLALEHHH